jgi:twitching motility protein PilT
LPKKPEGVIAAYELMIVTPAIANLIRENKVYRIDSSIQTGGKEGMFLMDEMLFRLWRAGQIDKEEGLLKSQKPGELSERIRMAEQGLTDDEDDDDDDEDEDEDDRPKAKRPLTGGKRRKDEDDDDD